MQSFVKSIDSFLRYCVETNSEIKGHNYVNNEWILSLIELDLYFMIINLSMKYKSNVFKRSGFPQKFKNTIQ